MTQVHLDIEGMTCTSCSNAITKLLSKLDFTSNININHKTGKGELKVVEASESNLKLIEDKINRLGYKVIGVTTK